MDEERASLARDMSAENNAKPSKPYIFDKRHGPPANLGAQVLPHELSLFRLFPEELDDLCIVG